MSQIIKLRNNNMSRNLATEGSLISRAKSLLRKSAKTLITWVGAGFDCVAAVFFIVGWLFSSIGSLFGCDVHLTVSPPGVFRFSISERQKDDVKTAKGE